MANDSANKLARIKNRTWSENGPPLTNEGNKSLGETEGSLSPDGSREGGEEKDISASLDQRRERWSWWNETAGTDREEVGGEKEEVINLAELNLGGSSGGDVHPLARRINGASSSAFFFIFNTVRETFLSRRATSRDPSR